jgi:hypothetical protein
MVRLVFVTRIPALSVRMLGAAELVSKYTVAVISRSTPA